MKLKEITITSEDFASLFEVSRRTVETWKKEGLPHLKRGILLFDGVRWWRAERFKEMDELRGARTRRETAKAKIAELEAAEKEKSLIPYSEAIKWASLFLIEIKQAIWTLPRRFAAQLAALEDDKEVELLLQQEMRRILTILADGKKKGMQNEKT